MHRATEKLSNRCVFLAVFHVCEQGIGFRVLSHFNWRNAESNNACACDDPGACHSIHTGTSHLSICDWYRAGPCLDCSTHSKRADLWVLVCIARIAPWSEYEKSGLSESYKFFLTGVALRADMYLLFSCSHAVFACALHEDPRRKQ